MGVPMKDGEGVTLFRPCYFGTLKNAMRVVPILIVPKFVPLNVRLAPLVAVISQPEPFVILMPLEGLVFFNVCVTIFNPYPANRPPLNE
jgi:hypothetical protein